MQNSHTFSYSDINVALCFTVINSIPAIILKTINNASAYFFRKHIFKIKIVHNFRGIFENDF